MTDTAKMPEIPQDLQDVPLITEDGRQVALILMESLPGNKRGAQAAFILATKLIRLQRQLWASEAEAAARRETVERLKAPVSDEEQRPGTGKGEKG